MRIGHHHGGIRRACMPAAALLIGYFVSGCDPNQTLFSGGRVTPTPKPPPLLHVVKGTIELENRTRHSGAQVFLGGTPYVCLTDTQGNYTLSGVPGGQYELLAEKTGFEELLIAKIELPKAGEPRTITQPAKTLKAIVREAPRAAIPPPSEPALAARATELDGSVTLQGRDTHEGVLVRIIKTGDAVETDSAGEFYFASLPPGVFQVEFRKDGFVRQEATVNVKREARNRAETRVLLPIAGEQTKRVVAGQIFMLDSQGQPRADFDRVLITIPGQNQTATLEPDGSFRLENLPAMALMISATADGYELSQQALVDMTMTDMASVKLTLVALEEDTRASGAVIGQAVRGGVQGSQSGIAVALAGTQFAALTSPSGDFQFLDVPVGTYLLYVEAEGFDPMEMSGVEIEQDQTLDLGELVLERNIEPPRVVRFVPDNGAKDIEVLERLQVLIQFSKPMDANSLKEAVAIQPEVDYQIFFGHEHPQSDERSLIIEMLGASPDKYVEFDEQYIVSVAKEATDLDGIAMEKDFELKFRTAGPAVIRSIPADGAKNVAMNNSSGLVIYLNDQIRPSTINDRDFRIRPELQSEIWFDYYSDPYSGWTHINVYGHWKPDTQYTVTLGSRIENMDGKKFENTPFSVTFRTSKRVPIVPMQEGRGRLRPRR